MKIEQKTEFQPITITLETSDEVHILCRVLSSVRQTIEHQPTFDFITKLSNWLGFEAKL